MGEVKPATGATLHPLGLPWGREFHAALVGLVWDRLEPLINATDDGFDARATRFLVAAEVPAEYRLGELASLRDLRRNLRRALAAAKTVAPPSRAAALPVAFLGQGGKLTAAFREVDVEACRSEARAALGIDADAGTIAATAVRIFRGHLSAEAFFLLAALHDPAIRRRVRPCSLCGRYWLGRSGRPGAARRYFCPKPSPCAASARKSPEARAQRAAQAGSNRRRKYGW